MVIDKGLGLAQTADLLELAGAHIDYIKLGFGTAALYPEAILRQKIQQIRTAGIQVYPGGTFLEVALVQGRLDAYLDRAKALGFTCIEVSDGTIQLPPALRRQAIAAAGRRGFRVITEVGKKEAGSYLDPDEALTLIASDLQAGAAKVIVEGRESGADTGIFDKAGQVMADALEQIAAGLPDPSVLMWEAPLKSQQEELIARFGPNVCLGNIAPADVVALEALRRGLRGDTLRLALAAGIAPGGGEWV